MEEETGETHSEEDKALSDKNKKRTVKTRAQIQALEKFYKDEKYPSESMKVELASSIGLTEKQISGWFCHRRLKDKRLTNGENNAATQKQDRSSGVVVQDSCGSTKQVGDKQLDTREVESGRLTPKSAGNYKIAPDGSSGSSSSLRGMYDNRQKSENPIRAMAPKYPVPRFPADQGLARPRTGPSGYLKVKGRAENPAITAVKQQLGENYRIDGPPLSVEFDLLPPDAFESAMQHTDVDETYYTEETTLPTSHNAPRLHHIPKFDEGRDYNSRDQTSLRTKHGSDTPNYIARPDHTLYSNRKSPMEFNEGSDRDSPISGRNREDYEKRHNRDSKVSRMRYSSNPYTEQQQPIIEKARNERIDYGYMTVKGSSRHNSDDGHGASVSHGENTENEYNYLAGKGTNYISEATKISRGQYMEDDYDRITMKRSKYDGSGEKSKKMISEANKFYAGRSTVSERRVKMKNDFNARESTWDDFLPLQPHKVSSIPRFEPEIPQHYGDEEDKEDDGEDDAETDSSAD